MKSWKTLLFEKSDSYYLEENDQIKPLEYLPYINNINIFIGTNNSGKSKFMRDIMSLQELIILDETVFRNINSEIDSYNRSQKRMSKLKKYPGVIGDFESLRSMLYFIDRIGSEAKIAEKIKPNFYYIPTLRTAHSLFEQGELVKDEYGRDAYKYHKIESDIFLQTLKKNYGLEENVNIFTGIDLYKDILNARNSDRYNRELFSNFEDFVGKYFFNEKKIDIVAEFNLDYSRSGDKSRENIRIHIEGEGDLYLYQLGDGIQSLIVLMYKIFMAEKNSYFFIDEPEINLHPGMQRLFLEQITSNPNLKEKNITYFISTHSNHFLDLTLEENDISIYSFYSKLDSEGKQLIIKNVNAGDNDVLKNIGVNNSSVFMANSSIWVEGVSDRLYIKGFLKSYYDHIGERFPKEDIDFAFFEYAGTNLDHYFFDEGVDGEETKIEEEKIINNIKAMSLSNRIFLLADSDNVDPDSSKGKRLARIESAKSNNFYPEIIRTHREIENFLPNEVWEDVLISLCNKTLVNRDDSIIKERINETLKNVNSSDYSTRYIGEFLNEIRANMGKIDGKYILNQSEYEVGEKGNIGTLKNKRALSELVAKKEFSWEILSKSEAIEKLTQNIYKFIENK
ncbi:ATP-dependent nuclease [Chryseobacterium sp. DT-3]|uniref:AAA family ATPase n=1 Tax=Chryseobacterium sp. DT-3 TaxID=3396164 RepID=UPI003F1C2017